jgi:hypothetical protein
MIVKGIAVGDCVTQRNDIGLMDGLDVKLERQRNADVRMRHAVTEQIGTNLVDATAAEVNSATFDWIVLPALAGCSFFPPPIML